ncbi:MAG: PDZ domain-containing protein [Anaerolineae bacterium]
MPVTVIDGQAIVGYDRPRLDDALARAQRPRLGAAVADAAEQADKGRTSIRQGAYVGRVSPGGAAAGAGLQPGDVIVALGGQNVSSALHLERLMARVRPGQSVPITYMRDGQQHQTTLRF